MYWALQSESIRYSTCILPQTQFDILDENPTIFKLLIWGERDRGRIEKRKQMAEKVVRLRKVKELENVDIQDIRKQE